jgi:hypothetical protein
MVRSEAEDVAVEGQGGLDVFDGHADMGDSGRSMHRILSTAVSSVRKLTR